MRSLKVKADFAGKKLYCPACFQELTVPAESEAPRQSVDPEKMYGVDSAPRDVRQMIDRFAFSNVNCPLCGTKIAVLPKDVGQTVECPDCGTQVPVTEEVLSERKKTLAELNRSDAPIDPNAKREIDPSQVYGVNTSYTPPADLVDALGHPIDPNDNRPKFRSVVQDNQFAVYCPLCATMQYVRTDQVGQTIVCPDCERPFQIYKPVELAPKEHQTGGINFEGGTAYGLAGETPPDALGPDGKDRYYDPSADPDLIPVLCKLCGTLMHAPKSMIGQKKKCPDCETETLIAEPKREKKEAEERIEPVFTGGYGVEEAPKPEELFRHEAKYLLGQIKTPIEMKLERERLKKLGVKFVDEELDGEARRLHELAERVKSSESSEPRWPEPFVPETAPSTPLADAVDRRNSRPQTIPSPSKPQAQTPQKTQSTSSPSGNPRPRRKMTPEEKTLARLSALESSVKSGAPVDDLDALSELPQIHAFKRRRGKSKKRKVSGGRGKSKDGFNGLTAKIDRDGNVVMTIPSPPSASMWTRLFSPLGAGLFWSRWAVPLVLGLLALGVFYYLIVPFFGFAGYGYGMGQGGAMVTVSAVCLFALLTAFWIRAVAVNFLSAFFALAGGGDSVEEWIEEDLVGGILLAGRFLLILAFALGPTLAAVSCGFGSARSIEWITLGAFSFFFPIVFLSTMQTDFPVMPITSGVFSTFFRRFGTWFFFYFWSILLIALPIWLILRLDFGAVQFLLFFAAVTFMPPIYSVLLGRLGWVIEDAMRD